MPTACIVPEVFAFARLVLNSRISWHMAQPWQKRWRRQSSEQDPCCTTDIHDQSAAGTIEGVGELTSTTEY